MNHELVFSFVCLKTQKEVAINTLGRDGGFALIIRPGEFFDPANNYHPAFSNTVKISGVCSRSGERSVVGILSGLGYVEEVRFADLETSIVRDTENGPVIETTSWIKQLRVPVA